MISELKEGEELTYKQVYLLIFNSFRQEFIQITVVNILSFLLRVGVSVLFIFFLRAISGTRMAESYILAACIIFTLYLHHHFNCSTYVSANLATAKVKSGLAFLLYTKVSSFTCYTIKSSELGKLIGLIGSDLSLI